MARLSFITSISLKGDDVVDERQPTPKAHSIIKI